VPFFCFPGMIWHTKLTRPVRRLQASQFEL